MDPNHCWLYDEVENSTIFSDRNTGKFDLSEVFDFSYLLVDGITVYSTSPATISSTLYPGESSCSSARPTFRSVLPSSTSRKSPALSQCSIKIVKANLQKGAGKKPTFEPLTTTYVELTEETANIEFITGIIKQRWGAAYTIVTNDAIPIEDSPTTQGLLILVITKFLVIKILYKLLFCFV